MAHDVVENDVKKEVIYSLIGTVAFLAIVALIAVSAYLRPAGDHVVPVDTATAAQTTANAQ